MSDNSETSGSSRSASDDGGSSTGSHANGTSSTATHTSDGPVTSMGYVGSSDLQAVGIDMDVPQDPVGHPQPASQPGPGASEERQGLLLNMEQTLAHCGMWQSTTEATHHPEHLDLGSDEPVVGGSRVDD